MTARVPQILIVGPPTVESARAYGGGTGGYTRNMTVYLATLGGEAFELRAFHHSVRGQYRGIRDLRMIRMFHDTTAFLFTCLIKRPDAVHVLAQYRGAIARELAQALICRGLRIPFGYDVKAGAFASSLVIGDRWYRAAVKHVINAADILFAEGKATQDLLKAEFGRDAVYLPNFVRTEEVPDALPDRLAEEAMRLLFVGFCHRDKGVFELVEGARAAARSGVALELDLIGAESSAFTAWVDALPAQDGLIVRRHGKRPHEAVLAAMGKADVYVYPTSHPGEGHNNSINEAMMYGLVILTSRQGFLSDVLAGDSAFFLDRVDADTVAARLSEIAYDRPAAREIGQRARQKLLGEYTGAIARERFAAAYRGVLGTADASGRAVERLEKEN